MERRGATEVLGIDLADAARLDLPVRLRHRERPGNTEPGDTFRLAAQQRGSRAVWENLSVYDLSPARMGLFDLVFIGYTLNLLQDPVAALEAIRDVCRGAVIVLDEISLPLTVLHRGPVAKFAPREGQLEWWIFNAAGLRRALIVAGFKPLARSRLLKFRPGAGTNLSEVPVRYRIRHAAGLAGVSLAIRASPS
jgi:tRNA (mo5U34)-methyltransferase